MVGVAVGGIGVGAGLGVGDGVGEGIKASFGVGEGVGVGVGVGIGMGEGVAAGASAGVGDESLAGKKVGVTVCMVTAPCPDEEERGEVERVLPKAVVIQEQSRKIAMSVPHPRPTFSFRVLVLYHPHNPRGGCWGGKLPYGEG